MSFDNVKLELPSVTVHISQSEPHPAWVRIEEYGHDGGLISRQSFYPEDFKIYVEFLNSISKHKVKCDE
ncbi:MAG: hypothetical protein DRN30_00780 [Thermoplasmata archaeon]|nr:MAG: hypothetical protein DRN30_00780 [Thermoplasmata archaeon]